MNDPVCDMCGNRCVPVREWLVTPRNEPVTVRLRIYAQSADTVDGNVCLSCLRTAIRAAVIDMDGLIDG